ncbi:MAG: CHAD domain-containing protein [Solirubrobacterales bacterium]|nr:CHAD domain-containing protein [Solirubrobacterales bacterium]
MSADLDPRFRIVASQVLEERATQITALSTGVLDVSEPAGAADLWLAARRLRAALEIFRSCLGRVEYREGRAEARRISRAVGKRRDIDVVIAAYESVLEETAPEDAGGLGKLVSNLRREQATANRALAQVVHGRRMQAFRVRIEEIADSTVGNESVDRVEEYRTVEVLPPDVLDLIGKRLARLRREAGESLEADGVEAQHRMRVAAERLRYALELSGDALGSQAHTARRAARGLQEVLSEIRDCDLAVPPARQVIGELEAEDVATIIERGRGSRDLDPVLVQAAPNRAAYRGVELAVVHLLARRQMLFERFKRLWMEQSRQGVWVALETSLKVES